MWRITNIPINKIVNGTKKSIERSPVVKLKRLEIILSKFNKANNEKYQELWKIAKQAIHNKKIFTIHSSSTFSYVRRILKNKGWVEKLHFGRLSYLLNELKASNDSSILEVLSLAKMVRSHSANLVWVEGDYNIKLEGHQLCNKIRLKNNFFTTKTGLYETIKDKKWNCEPGVSNVNAPRSYNVFYTDEMEEFKFDYKFTACTSLLKWFIINYDRDEMLHEQEGNVPFSTIHVALEACKVYMSLKKHKDIDKILTEPPSQNWDEFLLNYRKLISKIDSLSFDENDGINVFVMYAKDALKRVERYNPQLNWEGMFNVWIIKPANLSRGRGIFIESDLNNILRVSTQNNRGYIIQKYIEKPLLIYETKFDIRQYYLVTSTNPLTIWMYKNCYLRFVSRKYSLDNFHESVHLTNNAVQCKYKMSNEENNDIPSYKMWDLFKFRNYLDKIGHGDVWDEKVYPEMKQNVKCVMLCARPGLLNSTKCFELYGCDFVLDESFKPLLIEINACPDLSASTPITAMICRSVLEDLIKVVIDCRSNVRAPTGNFECIYREKQMQFFNQFEKPGLKIQGKKIPDKILHLI